MRQIDDLDIKEAELSILLSIDSFCREHHISYSMAYGTLLGAVRHRGFIPWDDDIDIFMLRKDFERFASTFNQSNDKYKLLWLTTDKHYNLPLPKVVDTSTLLIQRGQRQCKNLGVYVDIFIYDNIPDNDSEKDYILRKVDKLQKYWSYSIYNVPKYGSFLKRLIRFFVKKIDKFSRKYENLHSKRVGSLTYTGARRRFIFEKEWLNKSVELPFEGHNFFACSDYDSYLSYRYGNYLEPPKKKDQISNHSFVAYYKYEKD